MTDGIFDEQDEIRNENAEHEGTKATREQLMSAAREAVQAWADWCHQNEAQWNGWSDMIIPPGATAWTNEAEKVLAAFPVAITAGDRA